MTLEAIPNHNDLFNMMLYEPLHGTQYGGTVENSAVLEQGQNLGDGSGLSSPMMPSGQFPARVTANRWANLGVRGRNKRTRRPKVCKNKEEAEKQRMTHISVERNRRKQMNEHLAALRSLMPESYAQRGDQASIVGGAIEYVKELEHLVDSFEAQKLLLLQQTEGMRSGLKDSPSASILNTKPLAFPSVEFFSDPQLPASQVCNKCTLKSKAGLADIEVIVIESHANLRILSRKNPRQLWKLVSGFQTLRLSILHLNVTSLDPLVLYSISAKVEEGCQLTTADGIAEAVLHMLRLIQQDAASSLLIH